jgi:hypothetical protein
LISTAAAARARGWRRWSRRFAPCATRRGCRSRSTAPRTARARRRPPALCAIYSSDRSPCVPPAHAEAGKMLHCGCESADTRAGRTGRRPRPGGAADASPSERPPAPPSRHPRALAWLDAAPPRALDEGTLGRAGSFAAGARLGHPRRRRGA